jgi:hypothetical protein
VSEIALTPGQEVADAEALHQALEDRILDGDESVTPDELTQARGLMRFASLRKAAAERRAEQERHDKAVADAEKYVADVVARATRLVNGAPDLDKLQAGAVEAVRAYIDAARETHDQLRASASEITGAEGTARDLGIESPGDMGCGVNSDLVWVTGKDGKRHDLRLGDFATRAVIRNLWEGAELGTLGIGGEPQLKSELRDYHLDHNRVTFDL